MRRLAFAGRRVPFPAPLGAVCGTAATGDGAAGAGVGSGARSLAVDDDDAAAAAAAAAAVVFFFRRRFFFDGVEFTGPVAGLGCGFTGCASGATVVVAGGGISPS